MEKIALVEKLFDTEGQWKTIEHTIVLEGVEVDVEVGKAYVITRDGDDESYLEDITIKAEYRNQGIGTTTIQELAKQYGYIYFAPTGEDNKRLYERIAEEEPAHMNHDAVDQGYGVYYLEG